MKDKIIKLTSAAYKLLEFFPESDPLKNRAKKKVLSIMENLALASEGGDWLSFKDYFSKEREKSKIKLLQDIDILLEYFEVGKSQGWLSGVNCLIVCNEYEKLKKETNLRPGLIQRLPVESADLELDKSFQKADVPENNSGSAEKPNEVSGRQSPPSPAVSARQGIILEFLNENGKAQVMDLQKILPNVTKRTIRRDLDELLKINKIQRLGEFNQVFYKISQA